MEQEVTEVKDLVQAKFENFKKDTEITDDVLETATEVVESKNLDSLLSMEESKALDVLNFMVYLVGDEVDTEGKFEVSNLIKTNSSNEDIKNLLIKLKDI